MLKGKNIIVGITGGIAAYKIANLARMLMKLHCTVHVLMTQNATQFIHPVSKLDIDVTSPVPDDVLWKALEADIVQ